MPREASDILRRLRGDDPIRQERVNLAYLCAHVAEEIVAARERRGMTQHQLANAVGTSQSAIARVEDSDYDGHSLRTILKIAAALNLRVIVNFIDEDNRAASFIRPELIEQDAAFCAPVSTNPPSRASYEQEDSKIQGYPYSHTTGAIRWEGARVES